MIYVRSDWTLKHIRNEEIDRSELRADPVLFYVVAAASFFESTVSLYTANLLKFFKGEREITDWLTELWEPEELTHGLATRRYVELAWPNYNWQKAYDSFYSEYSLYCKVELLRPTRAMEMLARCVTETGSSTMYRTISNYTKEPILKDLMDKMSKDEVKHYANFYYTLNSFDRSEKNGFLKKAAAMTNRYKVLSHEDLGTAMKHINCGWEKTDTFPVQDPEQIMNALGALTKDHFPYLMARNMMTRTLGVRSFWTNAVFGLMEKKIKKEMKLIA